MPEKGEPLLSLEKGNVRKLVRMVSPNKVFGFSTLGKPSLLRVISNQISRTKAPLAFIGGFPRGHFAEETRGAVNEIFCVDREPLDAWVVAGRFVYDFEWALGLAKDRVDLMR